MAMRPRRSRPPLRSSYRRGSASFLRSLLPLPPVNGYTVSILSPVSGASTDDRLPPIEVRGVSVLGTSVDIQMEWRTTVPVRVNWQVSPSIPSNWTPYPPTMTTEVLGQASGSPAFVRPPNELSTVTWFYRARVGSVETNMWSAWTDERRYLNVMPVIGSAAAYMPINVGVVSVPNNQFTVFAEMNIGRAIQTQQEIEAVFAEMNIGIPREPTSVTAAYHYLNLFQRIFYKGQGLYQEMNITTARPDPRIWWIRPEQGREGYVFHIFGHGFGSFQNQYDGRVLLGALNAQVSRWVRVPRQNLASEITVSGTTAEPGQNISVFPEWTFSDESVTLQTNYTIEYEIRSNSAGTNPILPNFSSTAPGSNPWSGGLGLNIVDQNGAAWTQRLSPAQNGQWVRRVFTIPSTLAGRTVTSFSLGWQGDVPGNWSASIRNYIVRNAQGVPLLYVTNEDRHRSFETGTYTQRGNSTLVSVNVDQETDRIIRGQGLDPDEITVEHGWLTVVVPANAVSAMVRVVLEGGA